MVHGLWSVIDWCESSFPVPVDPIGTASINSWLHKIDSKDVRHEV